MTDEETITDAYDDLLGWVLKQVQHRQLAEDLTGDAVAKALDAIRRGHGPTTAPRSWLFRIAHNLIVDTYRRAQRERNKLGMAVEFDAASPLLEHVTFDSAAPDEGVMRAEAAASLWTSLVYLTDDQRRMIELRLLGFRPLEIAAEMDRSIGAVKALQHRSFVTLRVRLSAEQE